MNLKGFGNAVVMGVAVGVSSVVTVGALLAIIGWCITRRSKDDKSGGSPAFSEHEQVLLDLLVTPSDLKVEFVDIGGCGKVVQEIQNQVVLPLVYARYHGLHSQIMPPKGVLLHGPPGCGKTLIAKILAKELDAKFLLVNFASIRNKWLGETEKLATAVFTLAYKLQPTVIFLDEIDAWLGTRTEYESTVDAAMKAVFLTMWDGLLTDQSAHVLVLAATNRLDAVDPAVLRRLPLQFYIPKPDEKERQEILKVLLKACPLAQDVDLAEIARITDGFTGSDLKEVCRYAAMYRLVDYMENHCDPKLALPGESQTAFHLRHHHQEMKPLSMKYLLRGVKMSRLPTYDQFAVAHLYI
nr:outer mitochondrial transmembrane helix translocase-like [Cherax quadricarinatus]